MKTRAWLRVAVLVCSLISSTAQTEKNLPWAMDKQDITSSSCSRFFDGPQTQPSQSWEVEVGAPIVSSPVVTENNDVIVASSLGHVVCVRGATGAVRWKHQTPTQAAISGLATYRGMVYATSMDGTFYAFHVETGQLRHRFIAEGPLCLPPTIREHLAIDGASCNIATCDGHIYSIDVRNWRLRFETKYDTPMSRGGFSYSTMSLWFSFENGALRRINPHDYNQQWSYSLPVGSQVFSGVMTAAREPLFDSSNASHSNISSSNSSSSYRSAANAIVTLLQGDAEGTVWAHQIPQEFPTQPDPNPLPIAWSLTVDPVSSLASTPAINNEATVAYVPAEDGHIHALDLSADPPRWSWTHDTEIALEHTPSIGLSGAIFVPGSSGIKALRPNGRELWAWEEESAGAIGPIALAFDDALVFGAGDGKLRSLQKAPHGSL